MAKMKNDEIICRFVYYKIQGYKATGTFPRYINSKMGKGLQVGNKIYFNENLNGKTHIIMDEKFEVTESINSIPLWASNKLITRYNNFFKDNPLTSR